MKQSINEQIKELAEKVVKESGLEFVHTETVSAKNNLTIRVFIDKQNGVKHADCELVSRKIEQIFDEKDFINSAYYLEVSSPGLERELYSIEDFVKFTGNLAKVRTNKAFEGQRNFRGIIKSVEGEHIIFEDKTNGLVSFPYSIVSKANLEIDLQEELKKAKS